MYVFLIVGIMLGAWAHARLTVVNSIAKTATCVHMLNHVITNTLWWVIFTMIMYMTFSWGFWVLLFCAIRFAFMLRMNWDVVCDRHTDIKKLLM